MRKEVHISTNFFESLEEVSSIMKEILENNEVERFEISPLVSVLLKNTYGFVEEAEESQIPKLTKIGKFKDVDVYVNEMSTTDYINY
jgi:hypothetical protein